MSRVASVGSINVDRTATLDAETLSDLGDRYDWFPAPGETVTLREPPDLSGLPTLPDLDWRVSHGGKGANQVVAAAGAEATAELYGMVGTDHAEADVLATLARRAVDASGVEVTDAPTGTAYVFLEPVGENRIAVVPGANAAVDDAYLDRHWTGIRSADALLVQHELPTETVAALFDRLDDSADRPMVVLDPAPAAGAAQLLAYDCVDVVTPNETEFRALEDVLADFDGTVARTRGPDSVLVSDGESFAVTPPTVESVDTTGAGDVFAGFLAARLASGDSIRTAVETATRAASLSITGEGAQDATPTLDEVLAYDA
jgi:ribokinase